jgi:sirohydrochlorin ferrochelatase
VSVTTGGLRGERSLRWPPATKIFEAGAGAPPLVLVAHGSRDPRSASTMRRLATGVAARWPGSVSAAFLDFNLPSVPWVLRGLAAGGAEPVVVPGLLTSAYHGRVDLPRVLAESGVRTRLTSVLGPRQPGEAPDPRLLRALESRLSELDMSYDGLVLMAAGTSHASARHTVESVASALSMALRVPCVVGYASACSPTAAQAATAVRAMGATRVVAASYFVAPGRLYDVAAASARSGGALGVAAPLGDAEALVDLVVDRASGIAVARSTVPHAPLGAPRGGVALHRARQR